MPSKKETKWRVWIPELGETEDDAVEHCVPSAKQAAEEHVEHSDAYSAEYTAINQGEMVAHVLRIIDPPCRVRRFRVVAETVPVYTALEIEQGEAKTTERMKRHERQR